MSVISQSRTPHLPYRPDIDGLRAIAVSLVVLFHAYPEWLPGGFIGVDIFFVISGFLISSILLKSLVRNDFELHEFINFYSRRVNRIFPALGFMLIFCFAFGWFSLLPNEYQQVGKHTMGAVLFIPNLIFWRESGYFDNLSNTKILLHLWSLGIEEQFYLIWPLILLFAFKLRIYFIYVVPLLFAASFFYSVHLTHQNLVEAFFSPASRFWELLCGAMLSQVFLSSNNRYYKKFAAYFNCPAEMKHSFFKKNIHNGLSILGLFLIGLGGYLIKEGSLFPGFSALLPVVGTMFIILGEKSIINKSVLSSRILVNIGLISYPVYLFHWPALAFSRILYGELTFFAKLLILIIVFLLSWIFYRRIEIPLRALKKNQLSLILILLFVVIFIFSYVANNTQGFSGLRFGPDYQERIKDIEWPEEKKFNKVCQEKYFPDQYCLVSNLNKPLDVAIYGDSQANALYWGLGIYFNGLNKNTINIGFGGCYPFYGIGGSAHPTINFNCSERVRSAYKFLVEHPEIKTVYFAFHHSTYLKKNGKFIDDFGEIKNEDMERNIADAFIRSIRHLEKSGKDVVLIYDLPSLNIDPKRCLARTFLDFNYLRCGKNALIEDFEAYENVLKMVKLNTSLKILNTHEVIGANFPISQSGDIMYRDAVHLSYKGSLFFADKYPLLSDK
jgi:peptidoglycan/LPS O-acetylase OafA/YrhL